MSELTEQGLLERLARMQKRMLAAHKLSAQVLGDIELMELQIKRGALRNDNGTDG